MLQVFLQFYFHPRTLPGCAVLSSPGTHEGYKEKNSFRKHHLYTAGGVSTYGIHTFKKINKGTLSAN